MNQIDKPAAGSVLSRLLARLSAAWRALFTAPLDSIAPPPDVEQVPAAPEQVGCITVRARPFSKEREFRLIGRRGPLVMGESCDDGPQQIAILAENHVAPADVAAYRKYRDCGKN